jgi:hypothetical protein
MTEACVPIPTIPPPRCYQVREAHHRRHVEIAEHLTKLAEAVAGVGAAVPLRERSPNPSLSDEPSMTRKQRKQAKKQAKAQRRCSGELCVAPQAVGDVLHHGGSGNSSSSGSSSSEQEVDCEALAVGVLALAGVELEAIDEKLSRGLWQRMQQLIREDIERCCHDCQEARVQEESFWRSFARPDPEVWEVDVNLREAILYGK